MGRTRASDALVVGGTGMLRGLVEQLVAQGRHTVVVSRHADGTTAGAAAVAADWSDPDHLAARLAGGRFGLAVLWVHGPHREAVTTVVEPLLDEGALVVQVWGSSGPPPRPDAVRAARADLTVRHVVLGFVREGGRSRWLTDEEIVGGVATALHDVSPVQVVGIVEPWALRS